MVRQVVPTQVVVNFSAVNGLSAPRLVVGALAVSSPFSFARDLV
jgi:hypothetical protein